MQQYFKKASGVIIKVAPNHDLNSLKQRFIECDVDGNELKKEKPKKESKKKVSK